MCLITDQATPFKASRNLKVYKIFLDSDNSSTARSPYQYYNYLFEKLYQTEIKISNEENWFDDESEKHYLKKYKENLLYKLISKQYVVGYSQGFHSLDGHKLKNMIKANRISLYKIYECTIPKGSLYYKDALGCIVSNQIIIHKKIYNARN